jgi:hypothetical protein
VWRMKLTLLLSLFLKYFCKSTRKAISPQCYFIILQIVKKAFFMENAWKLKWIDSMLEHVAMDESHLDDAADKGFSITWAENMIPHSP